MSQNSGNERAGRDALISAAGAIIAAVVAIFIFSSLNHSGYTNPDLVGGPSAAQMAK